jgi:hypothetical protein
MNRGLSQRIDFYGMIPLIVIYCFVFFHLLHYMKNGKTDAVGRSYDGGDSLKNLIVVILEAIALLHIG